MPRFEGGQFRYWVGGAACGAGLSLVPYSTGPTCRNAVVEWVSTAGCGSRDLAINIYAFDLSEFDAMEDVTRIAIHDDHSRVPRAIPSFRVETAFHQFVDNAVKSLGCPFPC